MKRTITFLIVCCLFVLLWSACERSEYHQLVTKERRSGISNDTIFHGIYFGMSRDDFFAHCWELHKQGVFRQGSNNMTVEEFLSEGLRYKTRMNFYPNFTEEGLIDEMPAHFMYEGWAPWNASHSADSLELDVVQYLEKKHGGNPFIQVDVPNSSVDVFVKVDGSRQILLKKDDNSVTAHYTKLEK